MSWLSDDDLKWLSDENKKHVKELEQKLQIATRALDRILNDFECVPVCVANEALEKIRG